MIARPPATGLDLSGPPGTTPLGTSMGFRSTRPRSASGKPSLRERTARIENNLLHNLDMMREHRLHTEEIKQRREEKAQRIAQELKAMSATANASAGGPSRPLLSEARPPGDLGRGNMWARCTAMTEHLDANHHSLMGHRTFLDEVHALRRDQAAMVGEEYDPDFTSAPVARRSRPSSDVPGTPVGAVATANTAVAASPSPSRASPEDLDTDVPILNMDTRPTSAGVATGRTTARSRPNTSLGMALGASHTRPQSQDSTRPGTALRPWSGSSRPPSAGSLKARFQSIEESLQKNKAQLQSNREGIQMVVKLRKEREEKMTQDFCRELRLAMGTPDV